MMHNDYDNPVVFTHTLLSKASGSGVSASTSPTLPPAVGVWVRLVYSPECFLHVPVMARATLNSYSLPIYCSHTWFIRHRFI